MRLVCLGQGSRYRLQIRGLVSWGVWSVFGEVYRWLAGGSLSYWRGLVVRLLYSAGKPGGSGRFVESLEVGCGVSSFEPGTVACVFSSGIQELRLW